ncbi:hypothetical protein Tco_0069199 [Tanacetum coccineum]
MDRAGQSNSFHVISMGGTVIGSDGGSEASLSSIFEARVGLYLVQVELESDWVESILVHVWAGLPVREEARPATVV